MLFDHKSMKTKQVTVVVVVVFFFFSIFFFYWLGFLHGYWIFNAGVVEINN